MGLPTIRAAALGFLGLNPVLVDSSLFNPFCYLSLHWLPLTLFSHLQRNEAGVPPVPVLFIFALELLAIALRADPNINGIPYVGECYKLNMFLDDALLTLTNPIVSLPNLQALLTRFAAISGLQMNPHKTTALNITLPESLALHLQSSFPYS